MQSFRFSFLIFVLLLVASTYAQPTCGVGYSAGNYCHFSNYTHIFVGRVTELAPAEGRTSYPFNVKEVVVAVERSLKGSVPLIITLDVGAKQGCYGRIEIGQRYIFNAMLSDTEGVMASPQWAELDAIPHEGQEKIFAGIKKIVEGGRQPILFGKITRPDGTAFANVKVTAKGDSDLFSAMTDADGRFRFDDLPDGDYKVAAAYPTGFMPNDYRDRLRETDERDFEVRKREGWPCGTAMHFETSLSARIIGTFAPGPSAWPPMFELVNVSEGLIESHNIRHFSYGSYRSSIAENGAESFAFTHLRPGRYVLRMGPRTGSGAGAEWNPLTTFYYPAARSIKDARVLEIIPGTVLDLDIEPPFFDLVSVRGRTQLSDATPISAGVLIIDAEEPSVFLTNSPSDRDRTDFAFTTIKARPVFICAGYQGVLKNGAQLSAYTKLQLEPAQNLKDVVVTLDKKVPHGTRWYDQCRKAPSRSLPKNTMVL